MKKRCEKCGRFFSADESQLLIDGKTLCETCAADAIAGEAVEGHAVKPAIDTRMTENRFTTSEPREMHGYYLARRLLRRWQENFVDEDTGEIIEIERNEIIADASALIDGDLLARIQFHLQAGDITEVEVSDQKRAAFLSINDYLSPWSVRAGIGGKKRRFLLYASSAIMAHEIAKDYIELNFTGSFIITEIKSFDYCIFIKDIFSKDTNDTEGDAREFYKIEVEVAKEEDYTYPQTFVLQTENVDTATIAINDWLTKAFKEEQAKRGADGDVEFSTTVKSGDVIACYRIIEKEFSQAYTKITA